MFCNKLWKSFLILIIMMLCSTEVTAYAAPEEELFISEEETLSAEELEILTEQLNMSSQEYEVIENPDLKVSYDTDRKMYCYTLPNGKSFYMSCPMAAASTDMVQLILGEGLTAYTVYKNGVGELVPQKLQFFDEGKYLLSVFDGEFSQDGKAYRLQIPFEIARPEPEQISLVHAPYGFRLYEVRKDGEKIRFMSDDTLFLEQDGIYELRFMDQESTGQIWKQTVIRDTTAPGLLFSKEILNGIVTGEVSFKPLESRYSIEVYYNGVLVNQFQEATLAKSGAYRIVVTDQAGNQREYSFFLKQNSWIFHKETVILLCVLILLLVGLMRYWRKHMRVL